MPRMEPEPYMANLRRGTVEFCVLALVRREAKYAAELGAELGELGLLTSEGTLYPLLSRLRRGRLFGTTGGGAGGGPPPRLYKNTPGGGGGGGAPPPPGGGLPPRGQPPSPGEGGMRP